MRTNSRNLLHKHPTGRDLFGVALLFLIACGGGEVPGTGRSCGARASARVRSWRNGCGIRGRSPASPPTRSRSLRSPATRSAEDSDSAPLDLEPWKKARTRERSPAAAGVVCRVRASRGRHGADVWSRRGVRREGSGKRDARLVAIAKGCMQRRRADLAPVECADAIVDPYLRELTATPC